MRLQRLFEMGPAELAFRGRQELFKAVERLSVSESRKASVCRFDPAAIDARMKALEVGQRRRSVSGFTPGLQELLQDRMTGRFFAGLRKNGCGGAAEHALASEFGLESEALVARADAVCRHEFDILGYGELSFGQPVNWHLDPVSGRQSPCVHWSRLDPLAPAQVGDSKVVWELNRHQWLLDLGQAYRLTGDEKYARAFTDLVADWIRRNPYARGINWSSALEVAMRLISWCWALSFFSESPTVTPRWFETLLGWLQRHAAFVERHLSRYFSPNTHLTVEALGLYYAGTLLRELRGATRWRSLGRSVLLEQLPLQVSAGGVYFEQSTRYQYYTAEVYLHFAMLAALNDDPLPELVRERLGAMLRFLLEVLRPDGTLPQVGDTDGGWLCPLVRRSPGDCRGLFAAGALFLKDSRLAWAAGSLTSECLWLFGPRATDEWRALDPAPPSSRSLVAGASQDYVVMRSGWDREAHQLIFDTGPLGCHVSSGHGHADLLAVQCSAFGENYLVDPGTGCYPAGSPWRRHFRSTQAHSTVIVDGLGQAETEGPFSWRGRPAARLLKAEPDDAPVYAEAQHEAYARLSDPVTHRRRVWFIDAALWLIVDDLCGNGSHRVEQRFQFAPLPVTEEGEGWIRARGVASSLLLRTFAAVELTTELVAGVRDPHLGWYSPNYGCWLPAPALTVGVRGGLPLRLATLLVPVRDPEEPPPSVTPRVGEGLITGLSFNGTDITIPDFAAEAVRSEGDDGVTA